VISLLSAVFAELPLAFLAFAGARRLLRATVAAGHSLRRTPHAARRWPDTVWTRPCRAAAPSGSNGPNAPGEPASRPDRRPSQN
jgi:hypothetical protein